MSKWTRTRPWEWLGVAAIAIAGCQEPTELIPATPPGVEYQRPLPKSEEEHGPEALGEVAARTPDSSVNSIEPALPTAKGEVKSTKSGVKYETLKPGEGASARPGQAVTVHYVGKLGDGTVFDSSRKKGKPATFSLAPGQLIKGWVEGVPGMKIGEVRKLVVPPSAGYGDAKNGEIPPDSTLYFEIELLKINQ